MSRTPTLEIDRIWSRANRVGRMLKLWVRHLTTQTALNENHPGRGTAPVQYMKVVRKFETDSGYRELMLAEMDLEEAQCGHEVVAILRVFERHAGVEQPLLHIGLTSCDITESTLQRLNVDSARLIQQHVAEVARRLASQALAQAKVVMVARTHGQPAQLTTYGHRIATVLGPLVDWLHRWEHAIVQYPLRPSGGAVGTSADLARVLTGWAPREKASSMASEATGSASEAQTRGSTPGWPPATTEGLLDAYEEEMVNALGFERGMAITRQTYHRSYDLHLVGLLVELASIAHTWATDRRLEAMLGLGYESRPTQQVGSSAMPHKNNPRYCERVASLVVVMNGLLTSAAQIGMNEWLEGDVAGSAARRQIMPEAFRVADQILINWAWAQSIWKLDDTEIDDEISLYRAQVCSAAIMQHLVECGIARSDAHEILLRVTRATDGQPMIYYGKDPFLSALAEACAPYTDHDRLARVVDDVLEQELPGNVVAQVSQVCIVAELVTRYIARVDFDQPI